MAKESLKLVTSSTPPRSAARNALAAAIDGATKARSALEECEAASLAATRKEIGAEDKLAALRESIGEPASPDGLIRALAAGTVHIDDVAAPEDEVRANINAAEREIETWRRVRELARSQIPAREEALQKAERRVEQAAREVVSSEADLARLITETEEMQAAVVERRLALLHLASIMPDGPDRTALCDLLARPWLREEITGGWQWNEATKARLAAFEALKHDANAEIPA